MDNDEHSVALCMLSASRAGKSINTPVANMSHIRNGQITEFWGTISDPQATIEFWK